jgi:hypothetical protein
MTRDEIFRKLNGEVSKTAILMVDGELRIVGKYCHISHIDGDGWDVWLRDPYFEGLTERKITGMIESMKKLGIPRHYGWRRLTGGADTCLMTDEIIKSLKILGIRRAVKFNEEQRQRLRQNLLGKENCTPA